MGSVWIELALSIAALNFVNFSCIFVFECLEINQGVSVGLCVSVPPSA